MTATIDDVVGAGSQSLEDLPLSSIHPAEDNLRHQLTDLEGLAASIVADGLIEPLIVERIDGDATAYKIIAGHRRHAAAEIAGLMFAPCIVRAPVADDKRVELMLIENLQREGLTPLEEAEGYRRLVDLGMMQKTIAERVGCSQSHVTKRLALVDLPDVAKELLEVPDEESRLTLEDAADLIQLKDHPAELDEVVAVLKKHPRRVNVRWEVTTRLNDIQRAKDCAERVAEGQAKGWQVFDRSGGGKKTGTYTEIVKPGGWEPGLVADAEAHAAEPCHGIEVTANGWAKPVCTDPKRHTPKGASDIKAKVRKSATYSGGTSRGELTKEREQRAAELAQAREVLQRLVTFLKPVLAKKIVLGKAAEFLAQCVLGGDAGYGGERWGCVLLGLGDPEADGADQQAVFDAFDALAGTPGDPRIRAAIAQALGSCIDDLDRNFWTAGNMGRFYTFVEAEGYVPGEFELTKLGRAPAAKPKAKAAKK